MLNRIFKNLDCIAELRRHVNLVDRLFSSRTHTHTHEIAIIQKDVRNILKVLEELTDKFNYLHEIVINDTKAAELEVSNDEVI